AIDQAPLLQLPNHLAREPGALGEVPHRHERRSRRRTARIYHALTLPRIACLPPPSPRFGAPGLQGADVAALQILAEHREFRHIEGECSICILDVPRRGLSADCPVAQALVERPCPGIVVLYPELGGVDPTLAHSLLRDGDQVRADPSTLELVG